MRLATWNCCLKFAGNLPHLLELGVDVAVVCEAQPVEAWPMAPGGRTVIGLSRPVGQFDVKHLAVVACEPWTVREHPDIDTAPPWTLPVFVDGPTPFTLLALWPVQQKAWPGYVGQIDEAAGWAEKLPGDQPLVLAGDFNAPIDSTRAAYARVVDRFAAAGLVDAYRHARSLSTADPAPEPTYFHLRRENWPFHIDHVVLPTAWAERATVSVGDYATWVGSGRSDHVPVVVDIAEPVVRCRPGT